MQAIENEEKSFDAVREDPGRLDASVATVGPAVSLFTGGIDRPYAFGLTRALGSAGVRIEVLGSPELADVTTADLPSVEFLNLYGDLRERQSRIKRVLRHLACYGRIMVHALRTRSKIFHILWNYKFEVFDRTVLMAFFKLLGKKVVLTAHNVNAATRDGNESSINRLSLKSQYRLSDHIFVHTEAMKSELQHQFGIEGSSVTVIPFGINNAVPNTPLTPMEAKQKIGMGPAEKVILFYGRIRHYKGLHLLVEAFKQLVPTHDDYRLVIAGEPKKDTIEYWREICGETEELTRRGIVIREGRFIFDEETEVYFKAADVIVMPYTSIFQSGVIFLAYSFGLPVIAADVGSLRSDIEEGKTGYLCRPNDPGSLAEMIERYFSSDLYGCLNERRPEIKEFASERNSWSEVRDMTVKVYRELLN